MDLKQIKQIIELMKRSDLSEFAFEEEGFKIKIRRGQNGMPVVTAGHVPSPVFSAQAEKPHPAPAGQAPAALPGAAPQAPQEEEGVLYIKSPMVGTFYRAATPDSTPFVEVNAKVTDSTPVCIIEAMKIMNEILAETSGTIAEILVENGQPVEYGQRLFKLRKA